MLETLEKTLPRASYLDKLFSSVNTKPYFLVVGFVSDARSNWLALGITLPSKGQDSVLVVRGEKGDLRAFYNVCSVAVQTGAHANSTHSGRFKRSYLSYHAWSYQLNGSLKKRRTSIYRLISRSRIDQPGRVSFLRTDNRRDETLESALGSGAERISRYPLEDCE